MDNLKQKIGPVNENILSRIPKNVVSGYYAVYNFSELSEFYKDAINNIGLNKITNVNSSSIEEFGIIAQIIYEIAKIEEAKENDLIRAFNSTYKDYISVISGINTISSSLGGDFERIMGILAYISTIDVPSPNLFSSFFLKWQEGLDFFSDKNIIPIIQNAIKKDSSIFLKTPEEISNYLSTEIELELQRKNFFNNQYSITNFIKKVLGQYSKIIQDSVENFISKQHGKEHIVGSPLHIEGKNFKGESVEVFIQKVVVGTLQGMAKEVYGAASAGGMGSGTAPRTLTNIIDSNIKYKGVNAETDFFTSLTLEGNINQNVLDWTKEKIDSGADFVKVIDELKQIALEKKSLNGYFIRFSSKEYSESSSSVKIKDPGSIGARGAYLTELGEKIGVKEVVDNLIFSFINLGKDLLYDNNIDAEEKIKRVIIGLGFSYMLEDFGEELSYEKEKLQTTYGPLKTIHVFFYNGKYLPSSFFIKQLFIKITDFKKSIQGAPITLSEFHKSNKNYYEEAHRAYPKSEQTEKRWNFVRRMVTSNKVTKDSSNFLGEIITDTSYGVRAGLKGVINKMEQINQEFNSLMSI